MATTVPNSFVNGTNADAPQVNANFTALTTAIDGVATEAGVVTPPVKMRGQAIIPATESRSNTAYGTMATPDQVTGIVLPTDGVLEVLYQAYWNESVDGAARAAIFIGANQLKISQVGVAAPVVQETLCAGSASITQPLSTAFYGLNGYGGTAIATGHAAPVTTGQVVAVMNSGATDASSTPFSGGKAYIFAAAGTYTVSIQFKASSGNVQVLNRRLWVEAKGY